MILSCWYSLESSCRVLSDEYPFARVSVIFQRFCIILCWTNYTPAAYGLNSVSIHLRYLSEFDYTLRSVYELQNTISSKRHTYSKNSVTESTYVVLAVIAEEFVKSMHLSVFHLLSQLDQGNTSANEAKK